MRVHGPDSLNSWLISAVCCFINTMMYGMVRLSGVLFVATVPRFDVSRQSASFPYTFATFVRNTSGPLVGYLGQKFGVRAVTTFGAVLGATGIGFCYFAESVTVVTILWGGVYGLGFGLGNILLPVAINQYFDKHRATASGISFSGACIGSFILPPIVEILLNTYGLSGTYLWLAGFILNCVPAALLLKKPNFEISPSKQYDCEKGERQSIVSGKKVKLYTVENDPKKCNTITKQNNSDVDILPKAEDEVTEPYHLALTYDEKIKRLSTQTLLSDYSIRMSVSEPLDVDQIIENSKGRRQVDPQVLEAECLSISSGNTDPDGSLEKDEVFKKDEVFEKDFRSASVQYEKPVTLCENTRALSTENVFPYKENAILEKKPFQTYENYGYQFDSDEVNGLNKSSKFIPKIPIKKNISSQSLENDEYSSCSYQRNPDNFICATDQLQNLSHDKTVNKKSYEWSDTNNFKFENEILSEKQLPEGDGSSSLGAFSIIYDPMFLLIAFTNAFYCFSFICMITILVDFARDLQIGTSNEKYVLMLLSVGDLIGHVGLGWITDRGYMTTPAFAALCFACQGLTTAAIVWSDGFTTLVSLTFLYGLSEAGLIVIFPVIVGQYIDQDKQTVAIPSSNFLSGPLCLAVSPLIGYFRDDIGAYDWIFYGIAILSGVCCIAWMLAPFIARCQKRR